MFKELKKKDDSLVLAIILQDFCTPAGVRTLDTLIKSQVLYQLSYGCIVFLFSFSALAELRVQRYGVFL